MLTSAGLGGRCCHPFICNCNGFGVVVSDLSLVFCASGAACVQLEPMVVRCQERVRALATHLITKAAPEVVWRITRAVECGSPEQLRS